jgi:molecular chaperone HscB
VQPAAPDADLFAMLGLPRRLAIDAEDLERRYHAASRAVHPDRFQTADPRERGLSLAASAAVNRAYRTLRDPAALGRYWLELHGTPLGENNNQVPPTLAAEVFAVQEKLEELRAAPDDAAVRAEVRVLRDELAERLEAMNARLLEGAERATTDALAALKHRLSEAAYLRTLLGDVDATLAEETRGTHHRH